MGSEPAVIMGCNLLWKDDFSASHPMTPRKFLKLMRSVSHFQEELHLDTWADPMIDDQRRIILLLAENYAREGFTLSSLHEKDLTLARALTLFVFVDFELVGFENGDNQISHRAIEPPANQDSILSSCVEVGAD